MRVLITGGGTGGHCTPAVAVAEALAAADSGVAVLYAGRSDGPEARMVPAAGLEFTGLSLGRMGSSSLTATPRLLTRMPLAYRQAHRVVSSFKPQVVLASGGYVSLPVALAARRRRVPVLLMEQNALPGRAVRWLAPRAAAVATSFPSTAAELAPSKVVCTGNPVRPQFAARAGAPIPQEPPRSLLVMGGSQGARHLNRVLVEALPELMGRVEGLEVTHLTGPGDHARVLELANSLSEQERSHYRPLAFVDDLADRLGSAGVVAMRAGGSSLAEVSCLARPMVLVPYPHASNHQLANARPYQEAGAATLLEDQQLTAARLADEVVAILGDRELWQRMARASGAQARPWAAREVAGMLARLAEGEA